MRTENEPVHLPDSLAIAGLIHIFIGWGFLGLGRHSVKHLLHNGYMGLPMAALLALPLVWLAAHLARAYPGLTVSGIFRRAVGSFFGPAFSLILILELTAIAAYATRESQLMVVTYFFQRTPGSLISLYFLAICLYMAVNGLPAVARLAAFMLLLPLAVLLALLLLGLKNVHSLNILPIMSGKPIEWAAASIESLFQFGSITALFLYAPYLRRPASVKRVGLTALAVVFPLFFLAVLGSIGTFGPPAVAKLAWATVAYFHVIDLHNLLLLEQTGLLFIIVWYAFLLVAVTHALFFAGNELHNLLPCIDRRWFILLFSLAAFGCTFLPLNVIDLDLIFTRLGWPIVAVDYVLFTVVWVAGGIRAGRRRR